MFMHSLEERIKVLQGKAYSRAPSKQMLHLSERTHTTTKPTQAMQNAYRLAFIYFLRFYKAKFSKPWEHFLF